MKAHKNNTCCRYLFAVLLLCVAMCACNKSKINPSQINSDTTANVPVDTLATLPNGADSSVYLALGDSYTIGQSVDSVYRYPAQTAAVLNKKGIPFSGIQYIAQTGWTTENLQAAIGYQNPQGPFAAVSLLIGVNDQYQHRDKEEYRQHFTDLLNIAVSLAGNNKKHVFVLSIPDYGITPFGAGYPNVSKEIDEFNAVNKEITQSYGIAYTDVTVISRNDAGDNTMLAPDGLHPSGKQYAQWAAALAPVMEAGLK